MTKLERIEQEIAALERDDFWRLSQWFRELEADRWDRQIEEDAKAGRLDKLVAKARADIAAGRVEPL